MILEGMLLGFMSWLSLMLSWWHLPESIKSFTKRHPVFSDLFAAFLTFTILTSVSKSILAVIGTIFSGLLTNFTIMVFNRMDKNGSRK